MNQIKGVIPTGEDVEISQLDGQLPEWAKTVLLKYSQFKMQSNDRRGGYGGGDGRQRYSGYGKPDYNREKRQGY